MINKFKGEHKFLSNFYNVNIYINGKYYASVEHVYQAYKATNEENHKLIQMQTSPRMAKKIGGEIELRNDWKDIQYDLMLKLVRKKFENEYLKGKLIETGDEYLEEGNVWHDQLWGNCICEKHKNTKGKNWLGEILMIVRRELNDK